MLLEKKILDYENGERMMQEHLTCLKTTITMTTIKHAMIIIDRIIMNVDNNNEDIKQREKDYIRIADPKIVCSDCYNNVNSRL